ncbi:MAG: hypothetical protein N2112_12930 [Gemmataceae bacterium]|nr:hypothetical protein [Gemmataceae bacterium]
MSCQTLLQQLDAVEPKYHFHPKRLRLLQEIAMWDSLPSLFRLSLHEDVQDFCGAVQYEALLDEIDQNLPPTYPNSRTIALWSLTLLPLFVAVTGYSFYSISQANTHQERADWYLFLFYFWLFFPIVGYGTICYVLKRNWIRQHLEPLREKYSFKPIVLLNYLRVQPHKRPPALRSQTLRNLILEQPSENV